jgi:hypothetical protein
MSTRSESLYQEYLKNQDLVTLKQTSNPDLFVLKYKRKVFFGKDLWNDFLRECRGLVVDKDWNIVSLPFTKIHNYGIEKDAPAFSDDEKVFASRKVNGFMIAVTWYKDDLLWSTTGSIDSDFVGYAKEIFESWSEHGRAIFRKRIAENTDRTFMFECVHPRDPHIVEEETGLYFIGLREKSFSAKPFLAPKCVEEVYWGETGVRVDDTYYVKFSVLKDMAKNAKHEGFVFESVHSDYRCSKIKSPHYLTKKFLMRGNWEKFLRSQKELPEEFIGLVSWIKEVERENFFELDERARREYVEKWFSELGREHQPKI